MHRKNRIQNKLNNFTLQRLHLQEITIVMEELNAKIVRERDGKINGKFRIGTRNERGENGPNGAQRAIRS